MKTAALKGLRVIDAATLAAGPLIATYLSEFGAEVIKVEMPGDGDPIRQWGATKDGVGLMWKSLGRNKKTVSLNLRAARGQQLFRELAATADVVIMNTRPSTMERWGLDYTALSQGNPGLIMAHVTAFGGTGPYSDRPGFGTLAEAMSGFAHLTGEPDGPPTLPGFMLADCVAGVTGAFAVMTALFHRERSGEGQLIDLSLVEPLARFVEQATLTVDQLGTIPMREGNRWGISVPRNTYRTSDDRWIALSASAQTIALRVFDAIGRTELKSDPEYADPQRRIANRDHIDGMVAEWVASRPFDVAMKEFQECGVAAGPVYDADQLMKDPHMQARGTFVTMPDDDLGQMRVQGPTVRLSATPGQVNHLGRAVGADNQTVYHDLLGLTPSDIAELETQHII